MWLLFLLPVDILRLLSFNAAKGNQLCEIQTFHKVILFFFFSFSFLSLFFCTDVWCLIRCDVFMDHRKHNRNDNAFDSLARVDHNNIVSVNLLCWTNWFTMKCKHYMTMSYIKIYILFYFFVRNDENESRLRNQPCHPSWIVIEYYYKSKNWTQCNDSTSIHLMIKYILSLTSFSLEFV